MNQVPIMIITGNISLQGGTERTVINLSNILTELFNYKVIIISVFSNKESKICYKTNKNIEVYHIGLDNKGKIKRIISYYIMIKQLEQIIDKEGVKVVIGTTHAFNCIITLICRKIVLIGWEHLIYEECPTISNYVRKWLYKRLDKLVLLSTAEMDKYSYVDIEKKQVIYNAISFDINEIASLDNKRIIYVGRLEQIKRVDLLIESIAGIKESLLDWHIDIYGDGKEKQKLIDMIKDNSLEEYITINPPSFEIQKEYLDSSIMVLTSRSEGLPMVLIESQTCGLPIVSFDSPNGPKEIITDGEDGFLVELYNTQEFGNKILKLIKNKNLRKQMGKCAKNNSLRFSKEKIANQWDIMITELLKRYYR